MSLIVAARFDTFEAAQEAARNLFKINFAEEDVTIFFVNPPGMHDRHPLGGDRDHDPGVANSAKGAGAGAAILGAVGAVVGALIGYAFHFTWILMVLGAGVGAYAGSLFGAMAASRKTKQVRAPGERQAVRHAGVLLAVHVDELTESAASKALRASGGVDVEKAAGRWQAGQWVDFDALKPPILSDRVASYPKPESVSA
jgi:hypothetical protein